MVKWEIFTKKIEPKTKESEIQLKMLSLWQQTTKWTRKSNFLIKPPSISWLPAAEGDHKCILLLLISRGTCDPDSDLYMIPINIHKATNWLISSLWREKLMLLNATVQLKPLNWLKAYLYTCKQCHHVQRTDMRGQWIPISEYLSN